MGPPAQRQQMPCSLYCTCHTVYKTSLCRSCSVLYMSCVQTFPVPYSCNVLYMAYSVQTFPVCTATVQCTCYCTVYIQCTNLPCAVQLQCTVHVIQCTNLPCAVQMQCTVHVIQSVQTFPVPYSCSFPLYMSDSTTARPSSSGLRPSPTPSAVSRNLEIVLLTWFIMESNGSRSSIVWL